MVFSKTYQALQKILALNNIQANFNYNNNEMNSGIFPVNGFQIKLFLIERYTFIY